MLRAVVWTLRQRRYAVLAVAMLVLAAGCIAAGTFEVHRYRQKVHDNAALRHNAHAAPVPLNTALVPLTGAAPDRAAVTFRHVSASGAYLPASTQFLADQNQDGQQGFDVVTPLRTPVGVLLVVRGFVAATPTLQPPAEVAAPPGGTVSVSGWLQPGDRTGDKSERMGHDEIATINPGEQATRLGASVYTAYLTLDDRAPGTAGLALVPFPSLSNPTGGAEQWQLASYVVQWYTFALLALLAPFLISRSEVREARRRFLGIDEAAAQFDAQPALPAGAPDRGNGAEVALRATGTLARPGDVAARRWNSALRLSDRYGRSLGPDATPDLVPDTPTRPPEPAIRDSRSGAHRSGDDYHGSYNDLLWELALADGAQPSVEVQAPEDDRPRFDVPEPRPRPIDPGGAPRDQG